MITGACVVAAFAIAAGWYNRDERLLLPEEGLGYWLGVTGLALMTLLLAYSLRKRFRFMRRWGQVRIWFEIHMLMGIFGPVAILFHSNFRLGSMNGKIALISTLFVAVSGIVGRVIYTRIHHGLAGRSISLAEVRETVEKRRLALPHDNGASEDLRRCLADFERRALEPSGGLLRTTGRYLLLGSRCRKAARQAHRCLRRTSKCDAQGRQSIRTAKVTVRTYIRAVRQVGSFHIYERYFALWHLAHLPLCFLLFATAAVHVLAVHMY